MSRQEDRLWERIRKWMNRSDVIVVFGLKKENNRWIVEWKASHWLEDDDSEGVLPNGVEVAISEEMIRNRMGDKTFELTMEGVRRAPEIISKLLNNRRRSNGC